MIRVKSTFLYDTGIVKTAMLALGQNTQSGWRISASHHLADIRRMDNSFPLPWWIDIQSEQNACVLHPWIRRQFWVASFSVGLAP